MPFVACSRTPLCWHPSSFGGYLPGCRHCKVGCQGTAAAVFVSQPPAENRCPAALGRAWWRCWFGALWSIPFPYSPVFPSSSHVFIEVLPHGICIRDLDIYKCSKGQNLAASPFKWGICRYWVCLWSLSVLEDACVGWHRWQHGGHMWERLCANSFLGIFLSLMPAR